MTTTTTTTSTGSTTTSTPTTVQITVADLTQATLEGTGTFDVLMRATKAHLEAEFAKNRIKGSEYSTVYLGSLTQVLQTALTFVLTKDKAENESKLIEKQKELIDAQIREIDARILQITAQTALINQQKINAVSENKVIEANACKLKAEYDLTQGMVTKTAQETTLLAQKTATEKAQITAMGVDDDSVVGRQKQLHVAQAEGFKRDAEQKAAKIMVDAWNVQRTTDQDVVEANGTNKLDDTNVGKAVQKLLSGIGA